MPRPTKLNESTVAAVEQALMQGYNVTDACRRGGISTSTFYAVKARGRRESDRLFADRRTRPRKSEERFLDISLRFSRAAVYQEMLMLTNLNRLAAGGIPVVHTLTTGHVTLPDGTLYPIQTVTTTYTLPNKRAACWLLERRWRERWQRHREAPQVAEVVGMSADEWRRIRTSPAVLPKGD